MFLRSRAAVEEEKEEIEMKNNKLRKKSCVCRGASSKNKNNKKNKTMRSEK